MKTHWLTGLLGAALVLGCGRSSEPVTSETPPPPPPAAKRGAPVVIPDDAPAATGQAAKPQPTASALPPDLVQQYQQHWNDPDQRAQLIDAVALHALELEDKRSVIPTYAEMLRLETTPELKITLLDELATLENAAALPPILRHLQPNEPEEVRDAATAAAEAILTSFAFADEKPRVEQIVPLLDSRYPVTLREAAITALEDIEDKRAIPHLQRLQQDPDEAIRAAAQAAVEWLQQKE